MLTTLHLNTLDVDAPAWLDVYIFWSFPILITDLRNWEHVLPLPNCTHT